MRISASPVLCSDTATPQPQDTRKPTEFKRGLVVPSRLLASGISSLVSAAVLAETLPSFVSCKLLAVMGSVAEEQNERMSCYSLLEISLPAMEATFAVYCT